MLVKKHLAMVCGLVLCLETWLPGVTFTVTDTADTGPKTLRQAIQLANTNPNPDTIVFNISGNGVKKISLLSPLFPVKYPVTIDGWSQGGAGYSGPLLIEIDGGALAEGTGCFEMLAASNTIRGLIINRFSFHAIALVTNGFNIIQGNYIGTDSTGMLARGNTNQGIVIVNSPFNLIGGTTPAARNVISGNRSGIQILGAGAHDNTVQGNYIGLNAAGMAAIPNQFSGITLSALFGTFDYASDNTIGGSVAGARNVISGNNGAGIELYASEPLPTPGPARNRIAGNF